MTIENAVVVFAASIMLVVLLIWYRTGVPAGGLTKFKTS
jgi:hypothetical protein